MSDALYGSNGCIAQEKACYAAENSISLNKICQDADDYCVSDIIHTSSIFKGVT